MCILHTNNFCGMLLRFLWKHLLGLALAFAPWGGAASTAHSFTFEDVAALLRAGRGSPLGPPSMRGTGSALWREEHLTAVGAIGHGAWVLVSDKLCREREQADIQAVIRQDSNTHTDAHKQTEWDGSKKMYFIRRPPGFWNKSNPWSPLVLNVAPKSGRTKK